MIRSLLAVFSLSCTLVDADSPSPEVELFRAELASPARFPVRHGLAIDLVPVQQALDRLARVAGANLGARFAAGLGALPRTAAPAASEYRSVVELQPPNLSSITEPMANEYVLDPSPERLALRGVLMALPTQMAPALGLSAAQVAGWAGFLRYARPLASNCGHDDEQPTICLAYGGLDVFVVTLRPEGAAWVPRSIAWQRRDGSEETAHASGRLLHDMR